MQPKRAAVAALAAALALGAAGCGDEDTSQFREDYNAAVRSLGAVNTQIAKATGGSTAQSDTRIAREFRKIAAAADRGRARLARLDPPSDAQDEYDALLSALREWTRDLRRVSSAARNHNRAATQRALGELSTSGEEIGKAEAKLKAAVDG